MTLRRLPRSAASELLMWLAEHEAHAADNDLGDDAAAAEYSDATEQVERGCRIFLQHCARAKPEDSVERVCRVYSVQSTTECREESQTESAQRIESATRAAAAAACSGTRCTLYDILHMTCTTAQETKKL